MSLELLLREILHEVFKQVFDNIRLTATSTGSPPDKTSLHQILQKVTDLPDLHKLKVWSSQSVAWRHDWNFENLLYLEINGLGCEQGTLNLPSFPALLGLRMSFGEERTCYHVDEF